MGIHGHVAVGFDPESLNTRVQIVSGGVTVARSGINVLQERTRFRIDLVGTHDYAHGRRTTTFNHAAARTLDVDNHVCVQLGSSLSKYVDIVTRC